MGGKEKEGIGWERVGRGRGKERDKPPFFWWDVGVLIPIHEKKK